MSIRRISIYVAAVVFALALIPRPLVAQATQHAIIEPDCLIYVSYIDDANSASLDNRTRGCQYWNFSYASSGFTALSIEVQSAADNNGIPGAWAAFNGTVVSGANPATDTTGLFVELVADQAGYVPWVRISLASHTGSGVIKGVLLGWKKRQFVTASIVGVVTVTGTVTSQNELWNGTAWQNALMCPLSAAFSAAGAGSTVVVAADGTKQIYVCHVSFSGTGTDDFKLVQGTGAACVTGPADLTGLYKTVQSMALDFRSPLVTAASQALCVNFASGVAAGGVVQYAQF